MSRGNLLELLRPDENGKVQIICSTNVFGVIRSLLPFSLAGTIGKEKQYIIVAGDSGRIVILEYNKERNMFVKIHQETFGKSGCRRIVPGQYLAVDPRGRACMIGAIEKQKLVYVLNRDAAAKLTISSPLEAHKSHNIVFSICGLDNGFENPIFATIELDYADTDQVSNVTFIANFLAKPVQHFAVRTKPQVHNKLLCHGQNIGKACIVMHKASEKFPLPCTKHWKAFTTVHKAFPKPL